MGAPLILHLWKLLRAISGSPPVDTGAIALWIGLGTIAYYLLRDPLGCFVIVSKPAISKMDDRRAEQLQPGKPQRKQGPQARSSTSPRHSPYRHQAPE